MNTYGYSKKGEICVSLPLSTYENHYMLFKLYNKFNEEDIVNVEMLTSINPRHISLLRKVPPEDVQLRQPNIYDRVKVSSWFEENTPLIPEKYCILCKTSLDVDVLLSSQRCHTYQYPTILRVLTNSDQNLHGLKRDNKEYILPAIVSNKKETPKALFDYSILNYLEYIKRIIYYNETDFALVDDDCKYSYSNAINLSTINQISSALLSSAITESSISAAPIATASTTNSTTISATITSSSTSVNTYKKLTTNSLSTNLLSAFMNTEDEGNIVNSKLNSKTYPMETEIDLTNNNTEINLEDKNANDIVDIFEGCLKEKKTISLKPDDIQMILNLIRNKSEKNLLDLTKEVVD
jgi:hypothetical protein